MVGNAARDFSVHFLVGSGRCGSTLLHEILCRHHEIAFISNLDDRVRGVADYSFSNGRIYRRLPSLFTQKGRVRFAPSEGYRAMAREISPMMAMSSRDLVAEDATPWLRDRLHTFFYQRWASQPERLLLHKLTGWPRVGLLHEVFPDARFVHVVRDGRAVANSWLQMPWWLGYQGPERWHWGELPAHYREAWESSGRSFAVLAGIGWLILIDAWEAARERLPEGSWIDVRYEDLLARPDAVSVEVLEFCGLNHDERFLTQLSRYRFDMARACSYDVELGPAVIDQLDSLMAGHLLRYGYEVGNRSANRLLHEPGSRSK